MVVAPGHDARVDLPFVDRPSTPVAAPPEAAWEALAAHMGRTSELPGVGTFARLVALREPRASGAFPAAGSTIRGFRVAVSDPPRRLLLEGRHRFSDYELEWRIEPAPGDGCELSAETRAAFPGIAGTLYRAGVIGSRAHAVLMRRMLAQIARAAEASATGSGARSGSRA